MVTGPSALWLEEFSNLFNKRFVILEYAPVPGVSVEDDFCIRQTPGQIDRITAGHHYIVLTVCYEDRLSNARQVGRFLTPPGMDSLELSTESSDGDRFIAIVRTFL